MKQPKARILVVEDDSSLLSGLMDVLVFNGYEVKGAADGGQGLKAGLEEQFDLILLDVMLPSVDGFTICKEPRARRMILSRDLKPAQMTTYPSRFRCAKSWCGSKRCCDGPEKT
jgi:CheY-like chemotaxis protein